MDKESLRKLLSEVRSGATEIDTALERLRHLPFEDLGFAKVDHHRAIRQGMPEVVFGQGKAPEHIAAIVRSILDRAANILVTRIAPDAAALLQAQVPEIEYLPLARVARVWRDRTILGKGLVTIACAGTSDLPVADEARITAETMGNEVDAINDIGVAGIHRMLSNRERLSQARVIVCCAGMEGALPSVIGGLVAAPVIAVPTSVGYGASFHGLAALLGMLNSCSSNVTVVNIDNGFGAGYVASLINRL